mgnify:CR=1 FL=1
MMYCQLNMLLIYLLFGRPLGPVQPHGDRGAAWVPHPIGAHVGRLEDNRHAIGPLPAPHVDPILSRNVAE